MNFYIYKGMDIKTHPVNTYLRSEAPDQFDFIPLGKYQYREQLIIPDEFDGPSVWQHLLTPPMNQGSCGACWAFATTSTLADRFNIQSNGKIKVILSPTKPVLCSFENVSGRSYTNLDFEAQYQFQNIESIQSANVTGLMNGACMGNTLLDAWNKLYLIGSNAITCIPYHTPLEAGRTDFLSLDKYENVRKLPLCSDISGSFGDMCADTVFDPFTKQEYGTPARFYRCLHFYTVPGTSKIGGDEYDIRKDIYLWGPVSTGIDVYEDFYKYDGKGIYKRDGSSKWVGGHAVEIVGWGTEDGVKYWWIKNSWGTKWGNDGYFKMIRGVNECGIEENIISPVPDFFYSSNYDMIKFNIWAEDGTTTEERKQITGTSIKGGGVDPENGYSRRVKATKPWVKIDKPISPIDLPDWTTFVAGRDIVYQAPPPTPWIKKQENIILLTLYILIGVGAMVFIRLYFM